MRILHIIETLHLGGAENFTAELCNAMIPNNEVILCCIKELGVTAKKIQPGIKVDCLKKNEGNSFGFIFRLRNYIRQIQPDVIHLHSLGGLLELAMARAFLRKHRFIITCHGHLSHYSKTKYKRRIRQFFEIPAFLSADTITSVSSDLKNILPWPVSRKVKSILNGIRVADVLPQREQSRGCVELIYAGRLAKVKNLPDVLHALRQIEDRGSVRVRFTILGEGPEKDHLQKLVKDLDLKTEVNFIGYVDNVRAWYRKSDMFILPSSYEGISIALLEGMAEGLAVVATDVGGNPDVVVDGTSGILVKSGNIRNLAAAIEKIACDGDLRKQLQHNAFNRVKTFFNIETTVCKYLELYQGV